MKSSKPELTRPPQPAASIPGFMTQTAAFSSQVLLVLILFAASCEAVARSNWLESFSPDKSLANWYYPFDIKWFRLENFVHQNKGVDAIILGSSLVNTGFIPEEIQRTYQQTGGGSLSIFNFGVEGLTIAPNSKVAEILVKQYRPRLLVFVTELRDYDVSNGLKVQDMLYQSAWFRYRSGSPDWRGWLVDHSNALQHYLVYRNWMSVQFADALYAYQQKRDAISPSGYEPDFARTQPGQTALPLPTVPLGSEKLVISDSRLDCLRGILDLSKKYGVQVLIVEMPVAASIYNPYGGQPAHKEFQSVIGQVVAQGAGLFLMADDQLIPESGRSNEYHLNIFGAPLMSRFIGSQLAQLASAGELKLKP